MKNKSKKAFTIIEVLIAILIFSLGITSIYMLISSSIKANNYTEKQIIAANLAREEIELVRNIRDSNYNIFKVWDLKNPSLNDYTTNNKFLINHIYKIENDYSSTASFPVKVEDITIGFGEGASELNGKMLAYRLCLDSKGRYTYDCSTSGNTKTDFYRYLKVEKVENKDGVINNALKVTSKVIWYVNTYHELEIPTIITDWKRL